MNKKQKRAAGEARQAANLEESRRTGLQALNRSQEIEAKRRASREAIAKKEAARQEAILQKAKAAEAMRNLGTLGI